MISNSQWIDFVSSDSTSATGGFEIGVDELVQLARDRNLHDLNRYDGVTSFTYRVSEFYAFFFCLWFPLIGWRVVVSAEE